LALPAGFNIELWILFRLLDTQGLALLFPKNLATLPKETGLSASFEKFSDENAVAFL
jgi:hypothetical protein